MPRKARCCHGGLLCRYLDGRGHTSLQRPADRMTPCASMAGRLDDLGHLCHVNCVLAFCSGAVAPGWVCRCSSDSERPRADNQNSSGDEEHRKAQRLDNKVPEPSGQGGSPRCRVGGCSTTKAPALVSTPLQRPTGEGAASVAPRGLRRLGTGFATLAPWDRPLGWYWPQAPTRWVGVVRVGQLKQPAKGTPRPCPSRGMPRASQSRTPQETPLLG